LPWHDATDVQDLARYCNQEYGYRYTKKRLRGQSMYSGLSLQEAILRLVVQQIQRSLQRPPVSGQANGAGQSHDCDESVHADLSSKLAYQAYDTNGVQHRTKIIEKVFVKKL